MAKYIEATKCAEIISEKLGIRLFDLVDVFAEIPSEDVIPRAEIDLLKSTVTHKEEEAYNKGYADAKKNILMDIKAIMQIIILDYKEIGSFDNAEIVGYVRDHLIAELEKRYTEGEK